MIASNFLMKITPMKQLKLTCIVLSTVLSAPAFANETTETENTWADQQRSSIRSKLHDWSNGINDWLGETDPNKPASTSLRVMLDNQWNKHDRFSYKPRVRGKIRLPVLKKHVSVVFGDEDLENQARDKNHVGQNYRNLPRDRNYDSRQARNDNASIGLRWSNEIKRLGIESDLDGGIRSGGDIFGRLRLSKTWDITDNFGTRLEQIYRYGTNSKHYLRTNLENRYIDSENTFIMNHTFLQYTHDVDEETGWGNSFYRQHNFTPLKRLSYGIFMGGRFDKGYSKFNTYGPFISYRQPIFRNWVFIQPEISFYNDKDKDRNHFINTFMRLEVIF